MACNNLHILNFTHTVVETGNNNTLIITDNNKCNSITIPQPVTNILQINSPGPQGPAGPSGSQGPSGPSVDTGSLLTTSSFNNYTSSTTSQFAGTASFATTASFALNAGGAGFPFTGNAVITGSLVVSGSSGGFSGITGSLQGTASYAQNSVHRAISGSGISISPASGTGSITITNTAPDQTVILSEGTGISISSAYPSFTITNNAPRIGPSYQQVLYVFSQVGSSDPTINGGPLVNTTEDNFTFRRTGGGIYELKADSPATPFTSNRTAVYLTPGYTIDTYSSGDEFLVWFEIVNTSTINIYSYNIGVASLRDDIFSNATLDIKIY